MSSPPEIAASNTRSILRSYVLLTATLVLVWSAGVSIAYYDALNLYPQRPFLLGVLLVIQGIFQVVASRAGDTASVDTKQRRARLLTLCIAGMVIVVTPGALYPKPDLHSWASDFRTFAYFFLVLSLSAAVHFGPGFLNSAMRQTLNDELTRTLRLQALPLGYFLLIAAVLIFSFAELYQVRDLMRFLPLGLAVGVVIPSLYFVFLDWRASRSG